MNQTTSIAAFVASLPLALFGSSAGAATYAQNFESSVATNQTIGSAATTTIGWKGYINATADGAVDNRIFVASGAGNPNTDRGYLAFVPNARPQLMAAVTTFSAPMGVSGATFTWTMGNYQPTVSEVRLLIKIGRDWYASNEIFRNGDYTAATFAEADTGAVLQTVRFSVSKARWRLLTLDPDERKMALGPVSGADLPSSEISGVGFLVNNNSVHTDISNIVRIDSLAISAAKAP